VIPDVVIKKQMAGKFYHSTLVRAWLISYLIGLVQFSIIGYPLAGLFYGLWLLFWPIYFIFYPGILDASAWVGILCLVGGIAFSLSNSKSKFIISAAYLLIMGYAQVAFIFLGALE
jgi:hypothetical protein